MQVVFHEFGNGKDQGVYKDHLEVVVRLPECLLAASGRNVVLYGSRCDCLPIMDRSQGLC